MKHVLLAFTLLFTLKAQAVSLSLNDVFSDVPTLNNALPAPKEITGVDVGELSVYSSMTPSSVTVFGNLGISEGLAGAYIASFTQH